MRFPIRIVFVSILLSFCHYVFGQTNPVSGKVITLNGDTTEARISIENPAFSPLQIIVSEGGGSSVTIYSPKTIAGFEMNGIWYVGAAIRREISPVKLSELSTSPELFYVEDTVFLEVVVSGEKELLKFVDNTGKTGYYIPRGEGYEWLVHKKYFLIIDERNNLSYNNNYIGQLILYLDDCPLMNRVLSSTNYDQESLIGAYDYYYGCYEDDVDYIADEKNFKFELSALAGLSGTKLGFSGPGHPSLTEIKYPWSVRFTGGVGIDLAFPNILNSWTFNTELQYSSYLIKANYKEEINSSSYRTIENQIGSSMIKLNTMLRGHLEVNYATVFLDLGFANSFLFGTTNHKNIETIINGQSSSNSEIAIDDLKTHNLGFIIGFGVKVKKISGFLRYELGGQIEKQDQLDSKINSLFLIMSYKIL